MGRNSITGRLSLGPGRGSVGFESTLERDFVRLMAFDPNVVSIEEQPVRIEYTGADGRPHRYTPDYLVHRHDSPPLLAEIKPERFLTTDLDTKLDAARRYAMSRGWVFEVWTEKNIRTRRLKNVGFLEPYRRLSTDAGRAARILRRLEVDGAMTVAKLLRTCWDDEEERGLGEDVLWHLLATGELHADLDKKLTERSVLYGTGRVS